MYKKTGEKDEFMLLSDDGGNTFAAEFLELIPFSGKEYAVMLEKGADEVLIFSYREEGKNEFFDGDISDEEMNAVFEIFASSNDEFDFSEG